MDFSYFLDSRLCGNATSASPARAAASCFIRLQCYEARFFFGTLQRQGVLLLLCWRQSLYQLGEEDAETVITSCFLWGCITPAP